MKILLWVIGALVAGFVLLIVAAALLFNPNDFRAQISAQAEKSIHRKLVIGDIHLSLFPTLGATIKQVSLSNADGFGEEPMAQVGEAKVGVRLLALILRHRAEISTITLKGLNLNLLRHADGKSNWDDFTSKEQTAGQKTPAPAPSQPNQPQPAQLGNIGGVDIEDANINYVDQQAKKSYAVHGFNFSTGSITIGKAFDFKLAFTAVLADPAITADVKASATLDADNTRPIFSLDNLEASVDASGKGVPGGKQQIKLSGSLDIDGDKGTLKLADGKLSLANLVIKTSIEGSGLDGDAARFAGPLTVETFDPRETFKALGIDAPDTADASALKQVSLSANLEAGKNSARLNNLTIKLDQSTLTGTIKLPDFASAAVQFALNLDQIDADRYMAPAKRNPVAAPTGPAKPGEGDDTQLPLDKLDTFNASGTVEINKLKLKNLNLAAVQLKLAAAKGAPKTIDLGASLYGGSLASSTRVTPGTRPGLAESLKLAGINAGPLLIDFMGKDYVTGTGNFVLDITGAGRTEGELKRALNGSVNVALQNGAVKGFNLAQLIRQGQALYTGQAPEKSDSGQQTDFTTMTVSGKITNGVLHSDDLNAASPLLRITGAGDVNLVNSTLDYTAQPTVVNTATGQGGKQMANLNGVIIPVRVYGPFSQPKYQLDAATALKQQAVQKLADKRGAKLGGQKGSDVINSLQGLFGKKQNQQQQPQSPPK
jgi:AsmA protein